MTGPTLQQRSLIFWPGHHGGHHLDQVDLRVVSSIGAALCTAGMNSAMIERAHALGLAVHLDGEAWRNQWGQDDGNRKKRFDALSYSFGKDVFDPNGTLLSYGDAYTYSAEYLNEQVNAGANLLTTPAHVGSTATGQARQNDLRLLESAAAYFSDSNLSAPDPDRPLGPPRQLFAAIALLARWVSPDDIPQLVSAYAAAPVDGFIVNVFNYGGEANSYELLMRLCAELQLASRKPVVVAGLGRLWPAALASGVAGVLTGPQRLAPKFEPVPMEEGPDEEEVDVGRGVHVYRRELLGGFELGIGGDRKLRRSFRRWPCACGFHGVDGPETHAERWDHNVAETMLDAVMAASGEREQATARIVARVAEARQNRLTMKMSPLSAAWNRVAPIARSRRKRDSG